MKIIVLMNDLPGQVLGSRGRREGEEHSLGSGLQEKNKIIRIQQTTLVYAIQKIYIHTKKIENIYILYT